MDALNLLTSLKRTAYRHYKDTGRRYTLTSGQVSDEYIDIKNTILHPQEGGILAAHVASAIGLHACDGVAGVELGGALLTVLVSRARMVPALVVRKEARNHGATVNGVDGLENLETFSSMKPRVWLIEDVITTGGSTLKALERLESVVNIVTVGVVAVVDREQGGMAAIKEKYPGLWVKALTTLRDIRELS
jgi:orotate phosphoribosyltransferase